ncbi:hypothetical protein FJ970_24815 [Mesorhizobium sp. B2-1-8]|uniref:hypothetical protein n=1 Tax=unclassified Mesorhizobium TaxID=325217 RepID=UPI0015E42571|nr:MULTISPECIES: hypothetical protein [unclassified Mesorhizobium]MBZ9673234.1 hypothetical protein [Mesorhizobium sp. ES1-3]MBZ9706811.1 hypothetical protein [Mesorhizobium sp. ESP7-2]UCI18286.1 hypothetical protein FJ970_24815 [Mesorhizobium sp. B2-1-8]
MGILSDLDKKLTDNMYEHGSELTDAVADLPRAIVETVDRLMPFIQPEAREAVRCQVLGLIHEYRIENPAGASEQG